MFFWVKTFKNFLEIVSEYAEKTMMYPIKLACVPTSAKLAWL